MGKQKERKIDDMQKVDIGFFLRQVCGIVHDDVGKMTHEAVRTFFPDLKRTSFAHVLKNPELLQTGRVILVRDSQFKPIPYMVPEQSFLFASDLPLTKEEQIEEILESFVQCIQFNSQALLVFEGNDLLDRYLVGVRRVQGVEKRDQLSLNLISSAKENKGLIIGKTGNVYSYGSFNINGMNMNETNLDHQASTITLLTDASALLVGDDNKILFLFDGIKYQNQNHEELSAILRLNFLGVSEKSTEEVRDIKNYSLSKMTVYELAELMNYYKRSNQMAYYHAVRRELIKKTESTKQYKERKEKQKRKD